MRTLHVDLGKNSYDIVFERGALEDVGKYIIRDGKKLCVITDDNVGKIYGEKVVSSLEKAGYTVSVIALPHGEKTKSFDVLPAIGQEELVRRTLFPCSEGNDGGLKCSGFRKRHGVGDLKGSASCAGIAECTFQFAE